jgi:hypothetical protein
MANKDLFQNALDVLSSEKVGIYGPESFRDYAVKNGFPNADTAQYISIDSYEQLNKNLKDNDTMVFRLGKGAEANTTNFALVKVKDHLKDFFLWEEEIFSSDEVVTFLPTTSVRKFYQFLILRDLTESSFVNLGLASGLIGLALGLDEPESMIIPATTQSTFKFDFIPHTLLNKPLTHNWGQVEIDSIFIETRNGKDTLFIIEAKTSINREIKSLSKHKLVYPLLAIKEEIPPDMPIVPVYIKVKKVKNGYTYDIAECHFPSRGETATIDGLKAVKHSRFFLPVLFENK